MTSITDISLQNFFIYNVLFGQTEAEEEEKILYFYPKGTDKDTQLKNVGLSEAIIKFSETFSDDPCDALQTEKTRKVFFQPEENFWMVMTVNVPKKSKGIEGVEYLGNQVQNSVLSAILKQAYLVGKLFLGPFTPFATPSTLPALRRKFDLFYSKYLPSLNLKNVDIVDIFQGVTFLPLDQTTFLHCQCFVNLTESSFPEIQYSMFLYDDRLVWSGLPAADAQVIFRYLVTSLIPTFKASPQLQNTPAALCPGRFLTGATNLQDLTITSPPPKVYLNSVPEPGFYHLVVYQLSNATLGLLIPSATEIGIEFYHKLDCFCVPKLNKLVVELKEYSEDQMTRDGDFEEARYVYFNSMNLATKTNLADRKSTALTLNKEVLQVLIDMHQSHLKLNKTGCTSGETIVKTVNDHWVVGNISNGREFYVTIQRKKTNLAEVSNEVRKVFDKQLKSIFFRV